MTLHLWICLPKAKLSEKQYSLFYGLTSIGHVTNNEGTLSNNEYAIAYIERTTVRCLAKKSLIG